MSLHLFDVERVREQLVARVRSAAPREAERLKTADRDTLYRAAEGVVFFQAAGGIDLYLLPGQEGREGSQFLAGRCDGLESCAR